MQVFKDLLVRFVDLNRAILCENLVGVYLHGSSVMGCFNPKKSDLDLLIVVEDAIPDDVKVKYMDMVVHLNEEAPSKGIELSIVKKSVCNPFVYPTPFELHFSIAHLDWYKNNPEDYVQKMKGTDKDLAAHVMIINHRGKTLYGQEIKEVFGDVSKQDYLDSIWFDIEGAQEDILDNTMYITLNLARVLAYQKDNLILSKKEGGEWGLANLPVKYHHPIIVALEEYASGNPPQYNMELAAEYAEYMLREIQNSKGN
jgi:streptomycin 3"-adenylyltransferase